MSGHCPTCGVVLPLSGEPNCYCEPPKATRKRLADPLSEDNHRPRHDGKGWHWTRCSTGWTSGDGYVLADLLEIEANFGPVGFCDCPC